jgi:hypothetical protein
VSSLSIRLLGAGAVFLGSTVALAATQTPLGSPLFFALAAVAVAAYGVVLARVWEEPRAPRRLLLAAFGLAVAFRVPLVIPQVGPDNDMMRYVWDGRVQRLGLNPYAVLPADPALAWTHNEETAAMPSRRARTPYPPAAQLFFRMVVGIHDSSRAMKIALVACDLLTILVLWRWLAATGRNEWLTIAYAWNPFVVLEVAHSGHIDALGALWITASAYWLTRRRTSLASIAFVFAVTTKFLPIVLAPLFWGRIKPRDALAAGTLFVLLYLPFTLGPSLPLGAVPNVVAHIRFNGPAFRALAALASPQWAAVVAVAAGLLVAGWARWRLDARDPAAWAYPMAAALALAPVIYPWYLLYFTPFLFSIATLPLLAWSFSVLPAYLVWYVPALRRPWVVPGIVEAVEYGAILATAAALALLRRGIPRRADRAARAADPAELP